MKKSISPILATVLIISLTLTVAFLISNWTENISQTQTEKISENMEKKINCESSGIAVENATYDCSEGRLSLSVYNSGNINLKEFKVQIKLTNLSSYTYDLSPESYVYPGETKTYYVEYLPFDLEEIDEIITISKECPTSARIEISKSEIIPIGC